MVKKQLQIDWKIDNAKLDTKILGKHIYQPESEPSR